MFFKSDQANVSDARDAVKKQLLRTLIQQVVDELNSESGEGFEEAIAEFLSNEDLASAAGTLKHALSAGIRQQIFPDLVKEVMEEITPATADLDELVSEHLEEVDISQVREQFRAGFKRQLQEKIIPASIVAAVDEAVTDESGEVEAMVSDAMQQSMRDADWLKDHVRRHADVLAEAQAVQTVIPMRFGCVFSNPTEVKAFVVEREERLQEALERLHNRSEFSVRVRFEGQGADSELEGVPAGVANFLRKAARDVEHAPRPDGIADRIHAHLSRFAGEAMRNLPLEADLMMHATYLVTVASEDDFREEIRKLSGEFHALGIRIEVSGPWPPYHFVDIDFDGREGEATI